jgi:hypothetical protein
VDQNTILPPSPSNHTKGADKDERPKIRLSSRVGGRITIDGLDSKELEKLEGAMHGHQWISVSHLGRLRAIPTFKELPGPVDDEMMQPFWRPAEPGVETQLELFPLEPLPDYSIPSIIIQSLCGYGYTPERYTAEAAKLQLWGFECLRSRRDGAGQFHELWLLSSFFSARGALKEAIDVVKRSGSDEKGSVRRQLDAAISFLCHNTYFGTLDATNQRAAMTFGD